MNKLIKRLALDFTEEEAETVRNEARQALAEGVAPRFVAFLLQPEYFGKSGSVELRRVRVVRARYAFDHLADCWKREASPAFRAVLRRVVLSLDWQEAEYMAARSR